LREFAGYYCIREIEFMTVSEATVTGTERVVVTVHGIRTFGQWQGRLSALIASADPDAIVYNYHYGFFSVLAFLIPPLRAIRVGSFRRTLQGIVKDHPDADITLVGHSFGTHMIGWAIAKGFAGKGVAFAQVILAGSVLRQDFDWQRLIDEDVVGRVINDCGADDAILLLSQFGVLFTGMAGRLGFSGATGVALFNRIHLGGHSHYFVDASGAPDDRFMQTNWLPLILGTARPANIDMRAAPSAVRGFTHWLIQNADGMKIAVIAALAILGWQQLWASPRIEAQGEKLARLRVVALQQLANDETVPQGVATLLAIVQQNPDDHEAREVAARWLPQLVDLGALMKGRGFPAFVEWNGRNQLLLPGRTLTLPGDTAATHAFSRDGKLLMIFDADKSIHVYEVASGKALLSVPTRVPEDDANIEGDESPPYAAETARSALSDGQAQPEDAFLSAADASLDAGQDVHGPAEMPSLRPSQEAFSMVFRESRDGSQLMGAGYSASASAGSSTPIIFLLDRRTFAWSLCEFSDAEVGFLEEDGRLRLFLQNGYRGAFYEIASPHSKQPCRYRSFDKDGRIRPVPAALAERLAASQSELPGVGIATFGWKPKPDDDDSAAADAANAQLVFPRLLEARALWSSTPLPAAHWDSLGFGTLRNLRGTRAISEAEGRLLRRILRKYAASPAGEDWSADIDYAIGGVAPDETGEPDRGTVVVSEAADNALLLLEGSGNTYASTLFCRMRRIGAPIDYCHGVNLFGDSTSVAISPGNRYIAGADVAIGSRPGLQLHDVRRHREIMADRQPQGVVHSVAFDPNGTMVFAATRYGIWTYDLRENGNASFKRLYQVAGLAMRAGEDEFMTASIEIGPSQIYYLTSDGLLQAISRKTGEVDWIQEQRGGQMILDTVTGQLAVWNETCVSLLHALTGARLTSRFCPAETYYISSAPEGEGTILGARFSDKHILEFWTHVAVFRFDRVAAAPMSKPPSMAVSARIARWLGWGEVGGASAQIKQWENRTGYDATSLPATLRAELNSTVTAR
jgi:hypothetical protein